jgi:hypothetical protein
MVPRLGAAGIPRAIPACREGADMAGPPWLAGIFAAVIILTAAYSASRPVVSRLRGRVTEFDADALHAVMGAAMAGMLVPRLNVLPGRVWVAVFGIAAAWFGWHAVRAQGGAEPAGSRSRYPVPHLIECAAMVYMLLPVDGPRSAHAGAGMTGMGASAGPGRFPALAVVLALFMLGYMVWTTDRLTALARTGTAAGPAGNQGQPLPAAVLTAAPARDAGGTVSALAGRGVQRGIQAGGPVLAPKLAVCGKLAMSLTMGYMLILMI